MPPVAFITVDETVFGLEQWLLEPEQGGAAPEHCLKTLP